MEPCGSLKALRISSDRKPFTLSHTSVFYDMPLNIWIVYYWNQYIFRTDLCHFLKYILFVLSF